MILRVGSVLSFGLTSSIAKKKKRKRKNKIPKFELILYLLKNYLLYMTGIYRVTLRSRYGTGVEFDKICMFCDKICIRSDKFVSIVVKKKCVNSGNINDICDKPYFIKIHTNITIFDTFDGTIPSYDLSISYIIVAHIWDQPNSPSCPDRHKGKDFTQKDKRTKEKKKKKTNCFWPPIKSP